MRRARFALVVVGVLGAVGGSPVIAEPPEGSPLPTGQRFESPEHGMAVTMPAGWLDVWDSDPLPIFEPVFAAAAPDGSGECVVERLGLQGSEANKVAEALGQLVDYPDFEFDIHEVGLPDGYYVLMHADYAPGGQPGASVAYVFTSDDGYAWLSCYTTEAPPEDLWLSIAETFEFLPE